MTAQFQFLPVQGQFYPQICVVGEEFNKGIKSWPEANVFEYTAGGCHLLLSYSHPTVREKEAFSDPVQFGLFCKYDLIFVSFQVRGFVLAVCPILLLDGAGGHSSRS